MNTVAEQFVKLALQLGNHDEYFVDGYYGPQEWADEAKANPIALGAIIEQAEVVRGTFSPNDSARAKYLYQQLGSIIARAQLTSGVKFTFDEESKAIYDVVAPHRPDSFYADTIRQLEPLLPGTGSLADRFDTFRNRFVVPADKVDDVFKLANDEAIARTKKHIELPSNEAFRLEYVRDKVWSGYNWYQGNNSSLIQINLDLPITIDRAVGLACHEGYPGHHVYNVLLETHLAKGAGWVEFTLCPLYSSSALISEGTAEYGVGLCFPPEDRLAFEEEVLYPAAGLDPATAAEFRKVLNLMGNLGYSSNDAARAYLDGTKTKQETIDWLVEFALSTPERAEQRLRFVEANRSYVVTYNVGEDMVRDYVNAKAKTQDEKWKVFTNLLSTPQVPSNLVV